jgi:TPP-dependent pyruvate/acetoin dehydrogenase alpha subunit
MKKIILISIAVASLSTTAPADARTAGHRTHHHHLVMGTAASPALLNANASLNSNAGLNGGDHAMHMKNLHDSGYNPKDDVDSFGNLSVAQ